VKATSFGEAVDFINSVNLIKISNYENRLFHEAFAKFQVEPGVTVYGPAINGGEQTSIISFTVKGVHPHDLATIADSYGVQFRAGHHCAMPALHRLGLQSTARISFGMYNTDEDTDLVLEAVRHARKMFTAK